MEKIRQKKRVLLQSKKIHFFGSVSHKETSRQQEDKKRKFEIRGRKRWKKQENKRRQKRENRWKADERKEEIKR